MRTVEWVAALVIGVSLAACGRSYVPAQQSNPVLIATAQEPYLLRAAVVRALAARRFAAENEKPGQIIAKYERGGIWFRVQIDYSPTQYQVTYLDSGGLDAHTDPESGALVVDARYDRWVASLARSIDQEIERPIREAAAAEAARRDYELQVAAEQRRAAEANRDAVAVQRQPAAEQPGSAGPAVQPVVQHVIQVPVPNVNLGGGVNVQRNHQSSQSTQNLRCCINGAFYACPSQEAFQSCVGSGPTQCTRDASRDGEC
jgi:hypothetical protein